MFLNDIPERLNSIKESIENNDLALASKQAHSLKGSSANIGAEGMRLISYEIETLARDGGRKDLVGKMIELDREFEHIKELIRKKL